MKRKAKAKPKAASARGKRSPAKTERTKRTTTAARHTPKSPARRANASERDLRHEPDLAPRKRRLAEKSPALDEEEIPMTEIQAETELRLRAGHPVEPDPLAETEEERMA